FMILFSGRSRSLRGAMGLHTRICRLLSGGCGLAFTLCLARFCRRGRAGGNGAGRLARRSRSGALIVIPAARRSLVHRRAVLPIGIGQCGKRVGGGGRVRLGGCAIRPADIAIIGVRQRRQVLRSIIGYLRGGWIVDLVVRRSGCVLAAGIGLAAIILAV